MMSPFHSCDYHHRPTIYDLPFVSKKNEHPLATIFRKKKSYEWYRPEHALSVRREKPQTPLYTLPPPPQNPASSDKASINRKVWVATYPHPRTHVPHNTCDIYSWGAIRYNPYLLHRQHDVMLGEELTSHGPDFTTLPDVKFPISNRKKGRLLQIKIPRPSLTRSHFWSNTLLRKPNSSQPSVLSFHPWELQAVFGSHKKKIFLTQRCCKTRNPRRQNNRLSSTSATPISYSQHAMSLQNNRPRTFSRKSPLEDRRGGPPYGRIGWIVPHAHVRETQHHHLPSDRITPQCTSYPRLRNYEHTEQQSKPTREIIQMGAFQ